MCRYQEKGLSDMKKRSPRRLAIAFALLGSVALASSASAHCDSPEGPVIPAVHKALEANDLTPALRWIKPEYEQEIREAFAKAQKVREAGGEARELADRYFIETFVRLHRAGEGAPYTGVKPAGTDPGQVVRAADAALQSGSDETLRKLLLDRIDEAVHQRFARAKEALVHADHSIEAGRECVEAYVAYVHFVEQLDRLTSHAAHGHGEHDDHPAAHHEQHHH